MDRLNRDLYHDFLVRVVDLDAAIYNTYKSSSGVKFVVVEASR